MLPPLLGKLQQREEGILTLSLPPLRRMTETGRSGTSTQVSAGPQFHSRRFNPPNSVLMPSDEVLCPQSHEAANPQNS